MHKHINLTSDHLNGAHAHANASVRGSTPNCRSTLAVEMHDQQLTSATLLRVPVAETSGVWPTSSRRR